MFSSSWFSVPASLLLGESPGDFDKAMHTPCKFLRIIVLLYCVLGELQVYLQYSVIYSHSVINHFASKH